MAEAIDVAEYILHKNGEMSAMRLHKLVYYCQAWHLVWEGGPLFKDEIHAWANGPVIPSLYELHRGQFMLRPGDLYAARDRVADPVSARPQKGRAKLLPLALVAGVLSATLISRRLRRRRPLFRKR